MPTRTHPSFPLWTFSALMWATHLNFNYSSFYILASSIISKFTFLFPFLNSYPKIVTDTSAILHDVFIHYPIPFPACILTQTNTHKQDHFHLPSFPLWTFWALLWATHLNFNYSSSYIFTFVHTNLSFCLASSEGLSFLLLTDLLSGPGVKSFMHMSWKRSSQGNGWWRSIKIAMLENLGQQKETNKNNWSCRETVKPMIFML